FRSRRRWRVGRFRRLALDILPLLATRTGVPDVGCTVGAEAANDERPHRFPKRSGFSNRRARCGFLRTAGSRFGLAAVAVGTAGLRARGRGGVYPFTKDRFPARR